MPEEKKEYPPIKEFKNGEWYPAWLGSVKIISSTIYNTNQTSWDFTLCDKIEGEEKRRWANYFTTGLNIPKATGKSKKFYDQTKDGNPSKLKKLLTAFGIEEEVLKTLGGSSLEVEPIRNVVKQMTDTKTVMIKIEAKEKDGKTRIYARDIKPNTEGIKMALEYKKDEPKKAPKKLGKSA